MKQLHDLNGKIVLIDYIKEPCQFGTYPHLYYKKRVEYDSKLSEALKSAIPTLPQDKSIWLELSEKCGGKLEEGVHYTLHRDKYSIGLVTDIAIPTPQEDLWEEAFTKCSKELYKCSKELYIDLNQVSMFIQVKEWFEKQQEFSLTRKS